MPPPGLRSEDPACQAAIDHIQANPADPMPKPEDVTLGMLRWLLGSIKGSYPDQPDAYEAFMRIVFLIDRIPGIGEFKRKLNSVLRNDLTAQGTIEARDWLSSCTGASRSDLDGLLISDIASLPWNRNIVPPAAPDGTEAPVMAPSGHQAPLPEVSKPIAPDGNGKPAVAASGNQAPPPSNTKQKPTRGPRRISKVQKALVILKYRAKRGSESIRVEDIAAEAGCTLQNLYKSREFKREWESARERRIRRGWKVEGVADCPDDSTLDVG
jgi:hypothetical protein